MFVNGSAARADALPCSRAGLTLLWAVLALVWFLPLGTPHLLNPDEGRYAEIPREMVASGDWVTPRLDGLKYFEKPPLQYWATAATYEVAGLRAWAVRLWPALCGFLGLALTFALVRRLYGERAAAFALLVQAGALLYIAMARVATLDMGLTFMLQLAMTALVLLVHRPQTVAVRRLAPLLLGVGVALAVLSKGLIGILIPAAVAFFYMVIYRDWRLLLTSRPWWTLVALLVLAAPWMVLVSLRNPHFAHFFFIFEHFQRYLSRKGFDRYQPAWFFLPVLAVGLVPWITLLPRAVGRATGAAFRGDRAAGLLLIWAAFVLAFFSASQSKLTPYILPMVPALAPLIGRSLAELPGRRVVRHLTAIALWALLVALVVLVLARLPQGAALAARATPASILAFAVAFALLALGSGLGAWSAGRGRVFVGAVCATFGALLFAQALLMGIDRLPRMRAEITLARSLQPWIGNYRHFYCVNGYVQTLPFYLRRTCTLVGYRGELDFGLQREPWRGIDDLSHFVPVWERDLTALAILKPQDYRQLQSLGVSMHVIYTAPSFVAVVKP